MSYPIKVDIALSAITLIISIGDIMTNYKKVLRIPFFHGAII